MATHKAAPSRVEGGERRGNPVSHLQVVSGRELTPWGGKEHPARAGPRLKACSSWVARPTKVRLQQNC